MGTTFWIITIVAIIIIISCVVSAYKAQCSSCGKWSAMKAQRRVCTNRVATTVTKTEQTKNQKGEVIATRNVYVPATKYYYDVYRQCKHCSHKDVVRISETLEN